MHTAAQVLFLLGLIGVLAFASATFSARQLAGTTVGRLRRRLDHPAVRNAGAAGTVSAIVLLAGAVLSFA